MGTIKDMAIRDCKRFSQGGFSSEILFITEEISVLGLTSKHHLSIDSYTGASVSSLNAHITINEQVMTAAGITTRDLNDKFILKGKKVSWTDAADKTVVYVINEVFPSETFGLIVMTLGLWHS